MACTVEFVDDVHAAIDHIHEHGRYVRVSYHMKCISMTCMKLCHLFFPFLCFAVHILIALSQKT